MAKVILSLENTILGEFSLDKARTTIGRRSVSDIHLDHLAVSGEHAAILKIGQDFFLEDVGSTNGTRVNAKSIKRHLLQHDDLIEFGKYQLKYMNEAAISSDSGIQPHSSQVKLGAEVDLSAVTPSAPTGISPAAVVNTPEILDALATARIKVLNGSNAGRELTLNKALTTLGKVGSQVAVITRRPHGYFITHIEGNVFPFVNGSSVGAQAFALNHHDAIELAGVKMEFYLESPSDSV